MSEKKKIKIYERDDRYDRDERDGLILGYTGRSKVDTASFYAPFNPFGMSEKEEVWVEVELIEDEREEAERKRRRG